MRLLFSCGLAFLLSAVLWSSVTAAEKPNIVLIYTDDLGYGDISVNGGAIPTPHIDRLAAEGLRFTNVHATSSTCTPSRYALLTGQYPWRRSGTGVAPGNAGSIIPSDQFTMPALLQKAGYKTAAIGKWHLGLGPAEGPDWNGSITPGPRQLGFDYNFIIPATVDRVPCVFVENDRVVGLDPADPITVDYGKKVGTEPTGRENPELLHMGLTHGHDNTIVNGIGRIGFMTGGKAARWNDELIAETLTNKAVEFIKANKDAPFFVYFATHDIHVPRVPHPKFVGKSGHGARGDVILQLDDCVATIMKTLDELGLADNTLLMFSSDNGPIVDDGYVDGSMENLGNHHPSGPWRGSKYSIFEAGTRVPFLLRWPGRVKAGVSDALVSQIDLFASLAALVGESIPDGAATDSLNMLPTLLGEARHNRPYLIEHSAVLAFLQDDWKYIPGGKAPPWLKFPKIGPDLPVESGVVPEPQLYDLRNDPGETKNVAPAETDRVREMAEKLKQVRQVSQPAR